MKKVAVILSGCGVFDGAEIHESVLTLLAIKRNGATYQCFAPDMDQHHVINHLTGEVVEGERRNVLVEAARIARGKIRPLSTLNVDEYDALLVPGGFGAAKNLSNFAFKGAGCDVQPDMLDAGRAFARQGKPAGYLCIAPAMLAKIYGNGVKVTIGTDPETASAVSQMGAQHIECDVGNVVVDSEHKVVCTPAYMLAEDLDEAAQGIDKLVKKVLDLS
ncbi:isoprenoid biosynthesis glyoxalase ElbB [Aliiglaciecola sp. CAU 1673]|uniref:isoprenoid biosynthesis glyoxalase ElbB n=1 Tax=Aliiglaciecola sp. CAU 1673 TaxID=3032595 RepID=UPI0023DA2AE5|nr:isoprenoid biosynthesis glyoxalase ElbB [Aliiglaciecola sp. CAU 1673]MDF2179745.1 isoprenoid biosynthesis glyoxalase ElbB [Aliiglaciecola sp. CAU 1673]